MQHSKLEQCLALLQVVEKRNQISFDDMLSTTKFGQDQLGDSLELLVKTSLITMMMSANNVPVAYSSTERGINVLRFFGLSSF